MATSNDLGSLKVGLKFDSSELKSSLSEINSKMNVLSSQIKSGTSYFVSMGQSTDALKVKVSGLTDKIELQKQKIEILRLALEESIETKGKDDKATQDLEIKYNKANEEINKMQIELNSANKELNNYGNETEKASEKTSVFGDVLKANILSQAVIGGIKAIGSAIKGVTNALKDAVKGSAEFADEVLTLSTQTGLSTGEIQVMKYQAELLDVSVETLTGAMAKNIRSISSGSDAYKELGIKVKDNKGNFKDSTTVFYDTIEALGKVENETKRDALSMQLFGKSAQDLNPLIKASKETLNDLRDEAISSGYVLDDVSLNKLGTMDDSFNKFKNTITSLKNDLTTKLAPSITSVADAITGMLNGSISVDDGMKTIMEVIKSLSISIIKNLPTILKTGIEILKSLIQGIIQALPQITPAIVQLIIFIVNSLVTMLPMIVQAGIDVIIQLAQGITLALPELMPKMVDAVILIVDTVMNNLDLIIEVGINLLVALIEGIIQAMPRLAAKGPEIVLKLFIAIIKALPKLLEAGIEIIGTIISGIGNIAAKMWDIGKNIVEGIWQGISSSFEWIKRKISEWVGNVVDFFKKVLGIASPSKLFAEEIGKFVPEGIAVGIETNTDSVANSLDKVKDMAKNMDLSYQYGLGAVTNSKTSTSTTYNSPIYLHIEHFENTRGQGTKDFVEEMEYYRKQTAQAKGSEA